MSASDSLKWTCLPLLIRRWTMQDAESASVCASIYKIAFLFLILFGLFVLNNGNILRFRNTSSFLISWPPGSSYRSKTVQDLNGLSGFQQDLSGLSGLGGLSQKPRKSLKFCFKNHSKAAHFLRRFLNGFHTRFERFLSGLIKKVIKTIKRPGKGKVMLRSCWSFFYNL